MFQCIVKSCCPGLVCSGGSCSKYPDVPDDGARYWGNTGQRDSNGAGYWGNTARRDSYGAGYWGSRGRRQLNGARYWGNRGQEEYPAMYRYYGY